MHDIASQLVSKWARYGPANKIHVTEDFARLTLDSIALWDISAIFQVPHILTSILQLRHGYKVQLLLSGGHPPFRSGNGG